MKKILLSLAVLTMSFSASARDQIRIVGSSTVYPFATVVAEEFGTKTDFRTPIVESTGTGGGFKLFCSGVGEKTPDISNASREIKQSEIEFCATNGVKSINEFKIGYDGIVLANSKNSKEYDLTEKQVFLALAKYVPVKGRLELNPYKKWSDIDSKLADKKIEVYGPPPTSGTRDAFVEIVMEKACVDLPEFKAAYSDDDTRKKECHQIREDGEYIESGENDNLIVQKLKNNENALGIFGYSFLEENQDELQGSKIDGITPTFEEIAAAKYPISRSLYIYVKGEHIGKVLGLKEFVTEFVSDDAASDEGYLAMKGMISLTEDERKKNQEKVGKL
ncbi:MAG TPA: phosphate ABC transporter substrate-binding protein [Alphaproteobacteria bacterium]|nr:phosphate ABC transporter substrate-binding protein [Alphaproteobacteria bacterium]